MFGLHSHNFLLAIIDLDHAVWHLFVLMGSMFHWLGVYFYVAPYNSCAGGGGNDLETMVQNATVCSVT
jgi:hypothetical protein